MTKATCPSCSHEWQADFVAHIPDEQRMRFVIESESDSVCAETLGVTITQTAKILKAIARDHGTRVEVFIESVEVKPRQIAVCLFVCGIATKARRKK